MDRVTILQRCDQPGCDCLYERQVGVWTDCPRCSAWSHLSDYLSSQAFARDMARLRAEIDAKDQESKGRLRA